MCIYPKNKSQKNKNIYAQSQKPKNQKNPKIQKNPKSKNSKIQNPKTKNRKTKKRKSKIQKIRKSQKNRVKSTQPKPPHETDNKFSL